MIAVLATPSLTGEQWAMLGATAAAALIAWSLIRRSPQAVRSTRFRWRLVLIGVAMLAATVLERLGWLH